MASTGCSGHVTLQSPRGFWSFCPVRGVAPRAYGELLETAALLGQAVIGLAYVNDRAIGELCPPTQDTDCHEQVRAEIVFGEPRSTLVEVSRSESIEQRLAALLAHLSEREPAVAWDRLLTAEGFPDWARITVAGHSQGGGHAAFIAQRTPVYRAVLFSATEPARWTDATGVTANTRFRALAHAREGGYVFIEHSWRRLRMPGTPTEWTWDQPVPEASQLFLTTEDCPRVLEASDEARYHGCTAADVFLPRDDSGVPRLIPLWERWLAPRDGP